MHRGGDAGTFVSSSGSSDPEFLDLFLQALALESDGRGRAGHVAAVLAELPRQIFGFKQAAGFSEIRDSQGSVRGRRIGGIRRAY